MISGAEMLFRLFGAHAVADMALQHQWMAIHKSPVVDGKYNPFWPWVLLAHSGVCGTAVYVATGMWTLGAAETAAHFATDWLSTRKYINFTLDQLLHGLAKIAWLIIWWRLT